MATDEQLAEWSKVSAPVKPDSVQDWALLVNSDIYPTIEKQREVIAEALEAVGAKSIRFENFSPTRLTPPKVQRRREDLPLSYIPTVRGSPVWWRVRWSYYGTEDAVPWVAERHDGLWGTIRDDWPAATDPTAADVLLDSVGGNQEPAPEQPGSLTDQIGEAAAGAVGAIETAGKWVAVGVGVFVAAKAIDLFRGGRK